MQNTAKIKEIFTSIQGEGRHVGQKHTFVRFCKCNLACSYCDTDFSSNLSEYNFEDLFKILSSEKSDIISFSGGEPLLEADFLFEFLSKYKNKLNKKIYLETNGTLFEKLNEIIDFVDIVAMDIKIKSATKEENKFDINKKFIEIAKQKELFLKVVFDENISSAEIKNIIELAKKDNLEIILQPKMPIDKNCDIYEIFEKFDTEYKNIRLIPQTHKFLNLA